MQILDTLKPAAGATVLDPFCGSGTVLVEALYRHHIAIGIDTNPIARLITKAKTTPLERAVLSSQLTAIINKARRLRRVPSDARLPTYWFAHAARNALYRLHSAIHDLSDSRASYRRFFLATLTSGHSRRKGWIPMYSVDHSHTGRGDREEAVHHRSERDGT